MVFEQITAVPARPIFAVIHSIFSSDTNISAFNMQKIFANFSAGMFILHIKGRNQSEGGNSNGYDITRMSYHKYKRA